MKNNNNNIKKKTETKIKKYFKLNNQLNKYFNIFLLLRIK